MLFGEYGQRKLLIRSPPVGRIVPGEVIPVLEGRRFPSTPLQPPRDVHTWTAANEGWDGCATARMQITAKRKSKATLPRLTIVADVTREAGNIALSDQAAGSAFLPPAAALPAAALPAAARPPGTAAAATAAAAAASACLRTARNRCCAPCLVSP